MENELIQKINYIKENGAPEDQLPKDYNGIQFENGEVVVGTNFLLTMSDAGWDARDIAFFGGPRGFTMTLDVNRINSSYKNTFQRLNPRVVDKAANILQTRVKPILGNACKLIKNTGLVFIRTFDQALNAVGQSLLETRMQNPGIRELESFKAGICFGLCTAMVMLAASNGSRR